MHPELKFHLRAFSRLIYYVTNEEDRFLVQLRVAMRENAQHVKVYNSAFGLVPLNSLVDDWNTRTLEPDKKTLGINEALASIYAEKSGRDRKFYVITDPERWFSSNSDLTIRRVLNIIHQVHNNENAVKTLICVSNRRFIPDKLARYTEVIQDGSLPADEIVQVMNRTGTRLKMPAEMLPEDPESVFKGLTSFEVQHSLIQAFKRTRTADPKVLAAYRFNQLKKTDLIQYIDTSEYGFDQIGGAGRFKEWAIREKAAWTPEGREFGLKPPRGVLAVGVWGAGKSLMVKSLGNTWGLPVIQLEMGKLRSHGVGDTEANVYRVISMLESLAPCLVWIDESEKSLAGSHSSSQTDGGTGARSLGILSTWIQETKADVCIAMTANSFKTLPVEFVSRMTQRWFFDLPSTQDRVDILRIHLNKNRQDPSKFNLAMLAEKAEALVGREIEQSVMEAMTSSFVAGHKQLDEDLLAQELESKPRLVRTMTDEMRETLDWVGFDPKVNDGVRARYAARPEGQESKFSIG